MSGERNAWCARNSPVFTAGTRGSVRDYPCWPVSVFVVEGESEGSTQLLTTGKSDGFQKTHKGMAIERGGYN